MCAAGGQFSAFFQPRLIILRRIDHQCAFHPVMTKSAQLGTNYFVGSSLDWRKPNRNQGTGYRVARNPHIRYKVIVNHILGGKLCDHGAIYWHMKFASRDDVVFAGRIAWINAEGV